jgi:peptide deformylase
MIMNFQIVKDIDSLKSVCAPCNTIKEGEKVARILLKILSDSKAGVGLAANQIGINKRVCVINVKKPIILINPEITGKFEKISFNEGCLSFPGDYILTERYANIAVRSMNHPKCCIFRNRKTY